MTENALAIWQDETKLAEIKKIFAPTLTTTEFQAFVGIGQSTGLNPFLKEIWAVKYGSGAASIFVGRDGYRKSAQANPDYDWHFVDSIYANDSFKVVNGQPEHEYKLSDRGALVGAYALCMRKKSSRPNYIRVDIKEYTTGQSLWKSKPETMIKKVAEAQVLRMTFQDMFGGTHDESEEFDNSSISDSVAPDDLTKKISGKTAAAEDVVDDAVTEETPEKEPEMEELITSDQQELIIELYGELGYDDDMIPGKIEELEIKMGQPIEEFSKKRADVIITKLQDQIKKVASEKPKEEKKSAVGRMGEKAKAEADAIKNSDEFKKAFPEETPDEKVSVNDAEAVFGEDEKADQEQDADPDKKTYETMTEEELRKAQSAAKLVFSDALRAYRADGSNKNLAARTKASNECNKITSILKEKGYDNI